MLSTVATSVFVEAQVTVLSVALSGLTVALRVNVSSASRVISVLSNSTEVTATAGFLTVNLQVALFPPQEAVMFAEPSALAVAKPVGVTDATV